MARWTNIDMTITMRSGDDPALETVVSGKGDLSIDGVEAGNRTAVNIQDRQTTVGRVPGAENVQNITFSIGLPNESFTHATEDRAVDALRRAGKWAAATTTDPGGRVHAVSLLIEFSDGTNSASCEAPSFRGTGSIATDGEEVKLSVSGTNNVALVWS